MFGVNCMAAFEHQINDIKQNLGFPSMRLPWKLCIHCKLRELPKPCIGDLIPLLWGNYLITTRHLYGAYYLSAKTPQCSRWTLEGNMDYYNLHQEISWIIIVGWRYSYTLYTLRACCSQSEIGSKYAKVCIIFCAIALRISRAADASVSVA